MQTIDIEKVDGEKAFYHFTNAKNYEKVLMEGLVPKIGKNSMGLETTEKMFFSKGNKGLLQMANIWIHYLLYIQSRNDNVYSKMNPETPPREEMELLRQFNTGFKQGKEYTEENIFRACEAYEKFTESNLSIKANDEVHISLLNNPTIIGANNLIIGQYVQIEPKLIQETFPVMIKTDKINIVNKE